MDLGPRFAKRVFLLAGIYGLVVLLPQHVVEWGLPAPIAQPEHFYGFIGVALSWQFVFLLIARDVQRYRPLMLMGVLETFSSLQIVPTFADRGAGSTSRFGFLRNGLVVSC